MQDEEYIKAGATIGSTTDAFGQDIVLKVRPPSLDKEVGLFKEGANLISYIQPAQNKDLVQKLQGKKLTVIGEAHAPPRCRPCPAARL